MTQPDLPRWVARNVLLDVDATVTDAIAPGAETAFLAALSSLVSARDGISPDQAEQRLRAAFDPTRECSSLAAERLGVDVLAYWREAVERLRPHVFVHPDAAWLVRTLHKQGYALYPATTNSGFTLSAKLALGGLASDMRVPAYRAVLGGAEVHPDGKSGPAFYRALMEKLSIAADETVMIGDNPTADLLYAQQAGLSAVVIVRRDQPDEWVRGPDGGIYVNTLRIVAQMLERVE